MRQLSHGICSREAEGDGCWGLAHSLLSPFNFATIFIYVVVGTNAMGLWKPVLSCHVGAGQAWWQAPLELSCWQSLVVLGIEPTTSWVGDKCSITQPQPQKSFHFLF